MLSDSAFPRFTGEEKLSERVDVMHDYMYQLLMQLRYTLSNIGAENFNDAELASLGDEIEAVQMISHALVGETGSLASAITGDAAIINLESGLFGTVSTLTATASELSARLESAEDEIAEIRVSPYNITLEVSTEGAVSTIALYSGNVEISSGEIDLSGVVTFSSLADEDDETIINGAYIETGEIYAVDIMSCYMYAGELTACDIRGSSVTLYCDSSRYDDTAIDFRYGSLLIGRMALVTDINDAPYIDIRSFNDSVDICIESEEGFVRIIVGGVTWWFEEDGIYIEDGESYRRVVTV